VGFVAGVVQFHFAHMLILKGFKLPLVVAFIGGNEFSYRLSLAFFVV